MTYSRLFIGHEAESIKHLFTFGSIRGHSNVTAKLAETENNQIVVQTYPLVNVLSKKEPQLISVDAKIESLIYIAISNFIQLMRFSLNYTAKLYSQTFINGIEIRAERMRWIYFSHHPESNFDSKIARIISHEREIFVYPFINSKPSSAFVVSPPSDFHTLRVFTFGFSNCS